MALTASITTPDGSEHPQAFAKVYPLRISVLPGAEEVQITLHCWHSEAAYTDGKPELTGYPQDITYHGQAALNQLFSCLSPLAAMTWSGDPIADSNAAVDGLVAAIESAVASERPEFSRA